MDLFKQKAQNEKDADYTVELTQSKSVSHLVKEICLPVILQYIDYIENEEVPIIKELVLVCRRNKTNLVNETYIKGHLYKLFKSLDINSKLTIRDITATCSHYVISIIYNEPLHSCVFCNRYYRKNKLKPVVENSNILACESCIINKGKDYE